MDFTANEGSGLNSTGGSNPPVSAAKAPYQPVRGFYFTLQARNLEALEVHEARIRAIK